MPLNEKAIIAGMNELKSRYYNSGVYSAFKGQGDAVKFAIDQKYQAHEQHTRSGFYLSTLAALYDSTIESFTQVYSRALPLFIFDSRKMQGEDFAEKGQWFLNRVWENMGADNMGGTGQWMALCRDVPIYNTAIAHPRWVRRGGFVEKPIVNQSSWANSLDWGKEYDILQNEPDILRIHPYNWFGEHTKGTNLSYEGFIDKWTASTVAGLLDDSETLQAQGWALDNLKALYEELKKGKNEEDIYYHQEAYNSGSSKYVNKNESTISVIWANINHIKGYEDDPNEYHIIYDDKRIYKIAVNHIPGFRQIVRVRSNPVNDVPFGRSLLAPNVPHNKIMNLLVNLSLDETIARIHNGWAVWENALENPNDFNNPESVNGIVYMKKDAKVENLPQKIGDKRSGTLDDILMMKNVIHEDSERIGQNDQSYGVRNQGNETATGRMILEQADNRRTQTAIINMSQTGLIPIGKQINLMALRNTPEVERRNLSYDGNTFDMDNETLVQIWNNNHFAVHDSVITDQKAEATKLTNFLTVARDVLLQHPEGLAPLTNTIRDIGRKMNITNVERYFPESIAPEIETDEAGSLSPAQVPAVPEQIQPPEPTQEIEEPSL